LDLSRLSLANLLNNNRGQLKNRVYIFNESKKESIEQFFCFGSCCQTKKINRAIFLGVHVHGWNGLLTTSSRDYLCNMKYDIPIFHFLYEYDVTFIHNIFLCGTVRYFHITLGKIAWYTKNFFQTIVFLHWS